MINLRKAPPTFVDESRILAEGQKDGERNIPEMGSYTPAQFEQALIAHGEQEVHRIYKDAALRIARLTPMFHAWHRRLQDVERRAQPVSDRYAARARDLGRDVTISFPAVLHVGLILFLGIGEFPLNTVVFRLFGEPEYLTYVMASTLAITIPLVGVFIGIHLRHSIPRIAGNILVGLLTPLAVGAALFAISVLRNTYIFSQFSQGAPVPAGQQSLAYALFALNTLVFFAAMTASFFAHDPDERLDVFYQSLISLERKKNAIQKRLFTIGTKINGEIQHAKSAVEQARAMTNERVALYRQTNMRFRRLLAPPSFRKNPEFPPLEWWPEVSLNSDSEAPLKMRDPDGR
jgi:tetrahydromethanopterin S-methyltransferase subunit G